MAAFIVALMLVVRHCRCKLVTPVMPDNCTRLWIVSVLMRMLSKSFAGHLECGVRVWMEEVVGGCEAEERVKFCLPFQKTS